MNNLFLLFLLIPFSTFSQGTFKITADTTSIWRVNSKTPGGDCWDASDYSYYFKGDTLLNGFVYKKLYSNGIYFKLQYGNNPCDTTITHFTNKYIAAIREDSNKIFVYGHGLLYDFNLSTGDSLPTFGPTTQFIDSIDNISINGVQHKRFFSKGNWIIEGIGSSFGLLEPIYTTLNNKTGYTIYEFHCFGQHDSVLYSPNGYCALNVGISKSNDFVLMPLLNIFPNPATDIINIDIPKQYKQQNTEIVIYNSQGAEVNKINISNNTERINLNINQLPSGVYFLRLVSDEGVGTSGSFIKL